MSRSLLTNETSELDLLDQRPFDQTDFDILKSYEAVVDGLAMLIGSHCEIVLHSLQDLKCSAIRIANGEHTGRPNWLADYRSGVTYAARYDGSG